ncbi:MAG TPA: tetratricopeptide repeat protein [Hanamia sp.]
MTRLKLFVLLIILLMSFASCHSNDVNPQHVNLDPGSVVSIKQTIEEYPDSAILKDRLIEAYRNEGRYDSAIAVADRELAKDSGSAYLWNIKATLYFENNDTLNAINSLKNAIEIYPLPEYLVALGTVYAEIKNNKALLIANKLLQDNKVKFGKDAYFIKGLYYNYANDPQKAIVNLDSCLYMDFTYMYAYREKAIALYNQAKYKDALKVLKRSVTIQNNFDEGYYWMGQCYEKLNQKDDAIQSYQNALLYDKNYTEARDALNKLLKSTN